MAKIINKEKALFNSGFELFTDKGIRKTSINDIVKLAGVAKGTFYTYYKDKYDLIDKIIIEKSAMIIEKAYDDLKKRKINRNNVVVYLVEYTDYIIEYFKENIVILKLLNKNLSWGLYKKAISYDTDYNIEQVYFELRKMLKFNGVEDEYLDETLFLVIELISSTCYSAIVLNEPRGIDEMKPILYKMLSKMVSA